MNKLFFCLFIWWSGFSFAATLVEISRGDASRTASNLAFSFSLLILAFIINKSSLQSNKELSSGTYEFTAPIKEEDFTVEGINRLIKEGIVTKTS